MRCRLTLLSTLIAATGPLVHAQGLCVQQTGPDAATVVFTTPSPATAWATLRGNPGPIQRIRPTADGLRAAGATVHRVTLAGLHAGTTYRYRLYWQALERFGAYHVDFGPLEATAEIPLTLRGRDRHPLSFVAVNDVHDRQANLAGRLTRATALGPYDSLLLLGDIVADAADANKPRALLETLAEHLAGAVPIVYVRGNHETRGAFARQLQDYLPRPEGRYYYAFDQGPVRFLVLDTGEDKPDTHPAYSGLNAFDAYRREQTAWLRAEVSSRAWRTARFRVVLMHIPLFGAKGYGATQCRTLWADLLNEAGVDLLLAGHTHHYVVHPAVPGEHNYPLVIGGGPEPKGGTFIRGEVTDRSLAVTVVRDDGHVVGRCRVSLRRPWGRHTEIWNASR